MARLGRIVAFHRGRPSAVTVSGLAGSGKSAAASTIAQNAGLRLFTVGETFRRLAADAGMGLEDYLARHPVDVHLKADRRSLAIARKGRCVLVGRLTGLIAGPAAYKIFLTAPLAVRAKRVAGRDGISYKEALSSVKKRDDTDRATYAKIYGINVDSLSPYNLVLDTQFFSRGTTARLLTAIVREALGKRGR